MRRRVLIVLLRSYRSIVFVFGIGTLIGDSRKVVVDDRLVILFAREKVWSSAFCSRLERMVPVLLGSRLLVLVGRTTSVGAPVANICLTIEVMRPALRELGTWDVGLEDLVDSSIV
jgi:hypothetical protein